MIILNTVVDNTPPSILYHDLSNFDLLRIAFDNSLYPVNLPLSIFPRFQGGTLCDFATLNE